MDPELKKFDLEYCKGFTPDQLRKIYNGEDPEVLDALISKLGLSEKSKQKKPATNE